MKNKNVTLVSLNENGEFDEILADHSIDGQELAELIVFDNSTGILLPSSASSREEPPIPPKMQGGGGPWRVGRETESVGQRASGAGS